MHEGQFFFPGIYSHREYKKMLGKKPGINVKLHLVLGLLLLPGRNQKLIVPMLGIPVEMS